jgi:hypothetical protein
VKVVRDKQNGFAQLLLERQKFPLKIGSGERIQGAKRLVHQEDWRISSKRTRNANALALPAGKLVRITWSNVRVQPD